MLRIRTLLSLAALAMIVLCGLSSTAGAMPTEGREEASPALQQLLLKDKAFIDEQRANGTIKLDTIHGNTAYNYAVATKLFWHSVSAYCADDSSLQDWSCTSCKQFGPFQLTQIMDTTANQGYVGYFTQGLPASPIPGSSVKASDPFVLVSFRGTVPSILKDWIEDLSFSKFSAFSTKYPAVSVHGGFWAAYSALKPKMMVGIKAALTKSGAKTIIVTGHSLGAAMAELAAIDLKLNEFPSLSYASYTQGTPRVGNAAFSALYAQQMDASFREIHQADLVPHLPPKLLGFSHAPLEIWFDEGFANYRVCNSTMDGEDPHCSDSLALPVSVSDHTSYRGVSVGGYCNSGLAFQTPLATEVPVQREQRDETLLRDEDELEAEVPAAQETEQQQQPRRPRIVLTEM